jgi:ABC-2 type transport system permease protein
VKVAAMARKELMDLIREKVYILAFLVQMVIVMGIVYSALLYTSVSAPEAGGIFNPARSPVRVGLSGELDLELEGLEIVQVEEAGDPFWTMSSRRLVALLVVPEDFQERTASGETVKLDLFLDNTNVLSGYADGVISRALADLSTGLELHMLQEMGVQEAVLAPVDVREVALGTVGRGIRGAPGFFELMYGLLVPFILLLPTFLAANMMTDSIVGEKEKRTYELLLTSPVSRGDIILGKTLPIILLATSQAALWMALLEVKGITIYNPVQVLLLLLLLDLVFVGFGIAISSFSEDIKDANVGVTVLLIGSSILFFAPLSIREGFYSLSPVTVLGRLASNPHVPPMEVYPVLIILLLSAGLVIYGGSRLLEINDAIRL